MRPFLGVGDEVSQHALQIIEDFVVPISDDCDIFLGEKARTTSIRLLLLRGMLPAIEFDGEAETRAVEIERKRSDRVLPSEMQAVELVATKRTP